MIDEKLLNWKKDEEDVKSYTLKKLERELQHLNWCKYYWSNRYSYLDDRIFEIGLIDMIFWPLYIYKMANNLWKEFQLKKYNSIENKLIRDTIYLQIDIKKLEIEELKSMEIK